MECKNSNHHWKVKKIYFLVSSKLNFGNIHFDFEKDFLTYTIIQYLNLLQSMIYNINLNISITLIEKLLKS